MYDEYCIYYLFYLVHSLLYNTEGSEKIGSFSSFGSTTNFLAPLVCDKLLSHCIVAINIEDQKDLHISPVQEEKCKSFYSALYIRHFTTYYICINEVNCLID